jgi:predicted transcriptional regulator
MEYYMKKQLSAKQKIVNYLSKQEGYNTLTTAQARARFGIQNVSARIDELRQEGHCIYTNTVKRGDGSKVKAYRMGKPTKAMVRAALEAGYSFTA